MTTPQLILHIGAPKCGSSAVQTALSMQPDLQNSSAQSFRYVGAHKNARPIYGADLSRAARKSAYGYITWPNFSRSQAAEPVFSAIHKVLRKGDEQGYIPIMSCEAWIGHPQLFANYLHAWGNPRVDVVAFLRPPIDWVNAAYWQWGVWVAPNLDRWMTRGNLSYNFGTLIQDWAKIPNLKLHVRGTRPDVVRKFASLYDLDLADGGIRNASSPAALIGFLLRNRKYRSSGHDAAVEFIFQRWCPNIDARKPWTVQARHVHRLRDTTATNLMALRQTLTTEDLDDVLQDHGWLQEKPYHAAIREGVSTLEDPDELVALYHALTRGIMNASSATQMQPPAIPECPDASVSVTQWDAVISSLLDHLLALDLRYRQDGELGGTIFQPVLRWLRKV